MKRASRLPPWPLRFAAPPRWLRWDTLQRGGLALGTVAALTLLIFLNRDIYQVGARLADLHPGQVLEVDITARRDLPQWTDIKATRGKQAQAALDGLWTRLSQDTLSGADREFLRHMSLLSREIDAAGFLGRIAGEEAPSEWEATAAPTRQLLAATLQALRTQPLSAAQMRRRIYALAGELAFPTENARAVGCTLVRAALELTWFTPEWQQDGVTAPAIELQPTRRAFRRGEVILRKGDVLLPAELAQLRDRQVLEPAPLIRLLPLAALMLFGVFALGVYLRNFVRPVYTEPRKLLLLAGLLVAPSWAFMTLGQQHPEMVGLMVIPAGCMAIAGLLGIPTAVISAMLLSVIAGLTAPDPFLMVLLTFSASLAGVMAVPAIWPARRAIPAVLALVAVNMVLWISLLGLRTGSAFPPPWSALVSIALAATAGAATAVTVAVGAIYLLARPFGITTHYRLMELSNSNQLLLRRLMDEAPGTYHSSVMVANIAEAVADALGVDPLLTRVAALYHDIGKLKRPAFFVENQAPLGVENIHQRLSPKLSHLILTSHVKDGVEIARVQKLPTEVVNIIREHHGTTLAAYFYHRALSEAGSSEQIAEHDFRYPGPKPSTREAAIVMLADSVQASVKSLKEPTPHRIETMVHDIIASRLDDGQFDDCDLTQRDLRRISEVLVRILTGLYTYTRLEYPDTKGEGARHRAHLHTTTPSETRPPRVPAAGR